MEEGETMDMMHGQEEEEKRREEKRTEGRPTSPEI